jgi:putative flippase GtrA
MQFIRRDLIRFVAVGSFGAIIDFGILAVLVHKANWNPFLSRAVAMSIAIFCTWWLHRHWTFATGRVRPALPQSLLYVTIQIVSVSINFGLFSALVLTGALWRSYPIFAAAAGSLTAAAITYVLSRWIAFAEPAPLYQLPPRDGL